MNVITLDFETYYDTEHSLAHLSAVQYVHSPLFKVWGVGIKMNDEPTEWFGADECADAIAQIQWAEAAVVCHNTLFDAYILTQYYKVYPKYYYDTAAMARGLAPNESSSLKNTCERMFPNDKTMRKGDELVNAKGIFDLPPDIEDQIAGYCIQDVDLTYALYNVMQPNYPQSELNLIDLTCRMYVEPKIFLNRTLLQAHKDDIVANTAQLIQDSGLTRAQLASQKQFAEHLESLNITVPTKKSQRTGLMIPAFSKTDKAYTQMCAMYPQYKHIWDAREAVKSRIEETRAQRLLDGCNPDGTLSVPLRYYAAHTGRFGGTEKINLQNLPRGSKLRNALQAGPDQILYIADLSNIEARMLAWLAKEQDLLDSFAAGEDVYSNFASQIYNRPITKENKLERYVGKTAILGLGYGMGANKYQAILAQGSPAVDVTQQTALGIVSQYRAMYPNIPQLWSIGKQLLFYMLDRTDQSYSYGPLTVASNALKLPNGMYLQYPHLRYNNGEFVYDSGRNGITRTHGPRLVENIVQALARIVITDQMLAIQNIPGISVVLTVHDEIIALGSDKNADETLATIMAIMKQPPAWCTELPLDAEGAYSKIYNK